MRRPHLAAILSQAAREQHENKILLEILTDLQTVWFLTNVINVAIILNDYLFIYLLFISRQCHNISMTFITNQTV